MKSEKLNGIKVFTVVLQYTEDNVYYSQCALMHTNPRIIKKFQSSYKKNGWKELQGEEAQAAMAAMKPILNREPSYRWFRDLD